MAGGDLPKKTLLASGSGDVYLTLHPRLPPDRLMGTLDPNLLRSRLLPVSH